MTINFMTENLKMAYQQERDMLEVSTCAETDGTDDMRYATMRYPHRKRLLILIDKVLFSTENPSLSLMMMTMMMQKQYLALPREKRC